MRICLVLIYTKVYICLKSLTRLISFSHILILLAIDPSQHIIIITIIASIVRSASTIPNLILMFFRNVLIGHMYMYTYIYTGKLVCALYSGGNEMKNSMNSEKHMRIIHANKDGI